MTTTLITGANKGLGYETARRLIEAGHDVIVGARDAERGGKAAAELGARFVQIDVSDDASVAAAAAAIGELDILINNAGIPGPYKSADEYTAEDAQNVYNINVFGVLRVTNALLPTLRKSSKAHVINVSSGLGSFEAVSNPERIENTVIMPLYTSSKSALNMLTLQYAKAIPEVRFNSADPGYTKTDFNNNQGHQTVEEGTDAVVTLALSTEGTGQSFSRAGLEGW